MFVAAVVAAGLAWRFHRCNNLLRAWADRNGFRLIRKEYCWVRKGPFYWTTSKSQTVYRVTVEDWDGEHRGGWVRCGSWWLGLWSDKVEARWDDPS
jgi:hypothetical protein